jgi:hypothetical protein
MRHGSPSLEFMHNATTLKMTAIGPLDFLKEQLLVTNPVIAVVWLAGLIALLTSARLRPWRPHGIAFLFSVLVLIASGKSRAAYMAPSYTLILPAGGIGLGRVIRGHAARMAAVSIVAIGGLATVPFALPVLPVDRLIAYQKATGFTPRAEEHARLGPLPQFMADRFGWQEMASAVERAYRALPPDEQARTYVFTRNYGEAGAIEYFSPLLRHRVLSGHNNYHLWFPQGWNGAEILTVGERLDDVHKAFANVREVGVTGGNPYSMPYEQRLPILLGTQPIQSLDELHRAIKHYN